MELQIDYTVWFKSDSVPIEFRGRFASMGQFKRFVVSRFNFSDMPVRHTVDCVLEVSSRE